MYRNMPDEEYIRRMFRVVMGYDLDLQNPKTFNEKIQWLKLYDRKPQYIKMVDKYEVKSYVAKCIGEQYIIPTFGVWTHFNDIDFNQLPNQFVLKCTHDSGGISICKDREQWNKVKSRKKLERCLSNNFYYKFREWPYKDVKPRIIAEQYMEDTKTKELRDYKFFCFNGEVKFYKVDFDRYIKHSANYYDLSGKIMELGEVYCPPTFEKIIAPPKNLSFMIKFANRLSANIPFLRVDFYEADEKLYFGELTFSPLAGFGKFTFEGNDELLGSWLKLPDR